MSDYELDGFDVAAHFRRKKVPTGVYVVIAVVLLSMVGSCSNQMDKDREARERQQRHASVKCTIPRASFYR